MPRPPSPGRCRTGRCGSTSTQVRPEYLLPGLPGFLDRYPNIRLHIGEGDRLIDLVAEGVDCAIRVGKPADSALVGRKLGVLAEGTFASPAYLRKARRTEIARRSRGSSDDRLRVHGDAGGHAARVPGRWRRASGLAAGRRHRVGDGDQRQPGPAWFRPGPGAALPRRTRTEGRDAGRGAGATFTDGQSGLPALPGRAAALATRAHRSSTGRRPRSRPGWPQPEPAGWSCGEPAARLAQAPSRRCAGISTRPNSASIQPTDCRNSAGS